MMAYEAIVGTPPAETRLVNAVELGKMVHRRIEETYKSSEYVAAKRDDGWGTHDSDELDGVLGLTVLRDGTNPA